MEALDSLGEGEALFTYTYPILFPLTIVYWRERGSGEYLGRKLVKGRISKPEVLSYSTSRRGQGNFGVGQVYAKEKTGGSPVPVTGLIGTSLGVFYQLSLFKSEDLYRGIEGYYSSLKLNKDSFTPSFYGFFSSGLKELKSSIGGQYFGLGFYRLASGIDAYRKSSLVFPVIRENIESSLRGIGVDLSVFDHSPIEEDIEKYLFFLESESGAPEYKFLVEFVDRDLDLGGGSSGRIVATKWFEDDSLSILDLEGDTNKHLIRVLAQEAESMGLTTEPKDLKAIDEMLPDFVGRFYVYLSSPSNTEGGAGRFGELVAVPIGYRIGKQGKSKERFEELEVDYLILSKTKVDKYTVNLSATRSIQINYNYYSPRTLYDLITYSFMSLKRLGFLELEETKLVGKEPHGSYGEGDKRSIRAIVDINRGALRFVIENNLETISDKKLNKLLDTPGFFLIRHLVYFVVMSRTYYLDLELSNDFRTRLVGLSSTDPIISQSSLDLEFYAGLGFAPEESSKSKERFSLICSKTETVERVYEFVEKLHSFISSKEGYFERKAEKKAILYSLSLLEELRRILLDIQRYSDRTRCEYPSYLRRFYFRVPNLGSLDSPELPLNPGELFKWEDFDLPVLRKLSSLYRVLLHGQELCARIGEDYHRFLFRGGLGEVESDVSNILGKEIETRQRSEVEKARSRDSLKRPYPIVEDFSWSIASLIVSSLMAYEKDNFLNLGTPWLEGIVKGLVDQLISMLTEWGDGFYVLNTKSFLRSLEAVRIKISNGSQVSIGFSYDDKGNFVPDNISVNFSHDNHHSGPSPESYQPPPSDLVTLEAFYLPSGIPGKSLKVGVGQRRY